MLRPLFGPYDLGSTDEGLKTAHKILQHRRKKKALRRRQEILWRSRHSTHRWDRVAGTRGLLRCNRHLRRVAKHAEDALFPESVDPEARQLEAYDSALQHYRATVALKAAHGKDWILRLAGNTNSIGYYHHFRLFSPPRSELGRALSPLGRDIIPANDPVILTTEELANMCTLTKEDLTNMWNTAFEQARAELAL